MNFFYGYGWFQVPRNSFLDNLVSCVIVAFRGRWFANLLICHTRSPTSCLIRRFNPFTFRVTNAMVGFKFTFLVFAFYLSHRCILPLFLFACFLWVGHLFFFFKAVHFKFSIGFLNIALCIFLHQSRQYKYPKFIKSTVK